MKQKLIVLLSLFWFSISTAQSVRYPQVLSVQGSVEFSDVQEKTRNLKTSSRLIEKAKIQTGPKSSAKIQLNVTRSLIIEEKSQVIFPSIGWDSQQVPLIILKSGSVIWQSLGGGSAYSIALSNDLFQLILPEGRFRFVYDSEKAFVKVQVLEGQLVFSALNSDETVLLAKGQEVQFQGQFEGGEIAYDILLKGKKIPKGVLGSPTQIPLEEQKAQQLSVIKEAQEKKARAEAAMKKKKQRELEGFICSKPDGKLNQCAWVCDGRLKKGTKFCDLSQAGVSCSRLKCNANGEWAEKTLIDPKTALQRCTHPNSVVGPCDY